jgi:S1-C subfamily serine protease
VIIIAGALAIRFTLPQMVPETPAADEVEPATHGAPPREAAAHPDLLLPAPEDGLEPMEPEQLYETVRRSVIRLVVRLDDRPIVSGSGAVIAIDAGRSHYFVVTNRHVIMQGALAEQTLSFEAEFENQARFDAVLDFYSRQNDLALLAVLGTPLWARPVAMRPSADLVVGERVYAVGSPMGLRHTFTAGIISALRDGWIQTDATVHSGSSGGPLFDNRGLLCGIVTSTHMSKDFSFAIPADTVLSMLEERRAAGGQRSNG